MDWREPQFEAVLNALFEGAYVLDVDRKIVFWNAAAEKITGNSAAKMVGRFCQEGGLEHVDAGGCALCHERCAVSRALKSGEKGDAEAYMRHAGGHRVPVHIRAQPLYTNGSVSGVLETFTVARHSEDLEARLAELERMARADALTGIANRRYLEESLEGRLDEARRYGRRFGVLYADLDDFKKINDQYGHEVGDRFLVTAARTLVANLRAFDVAARIGGEEFVAVIVNVDLQRLKLVAERFRSLLRSSWLEVNAGRVRVTASVGVTMAHAEDTWQELLNRADALMYRSKAAGKDRVTLG
jgi:diguanylate cyclase (GGDEF)-like protein/PAS domain S-box-containing protein